MIVIHGVGDTTPGGTLDMFVPPVLKATGGALREIDLPQNRLLREQAAIAPKHPVNSSTTSVVSFEATAAHFPMHLREFAAVHPRPGKPNHVVFAEVFWADLAAMSRDWWDLLKRLFMLIFDLRHVANVAAAYPKIRAAKPLRVLVYWASWLLSGPVAGMTVFMVYLLIGHHVTRTVLRVLEEAAKNLQEYVTSRSTGGAVFAAILELLSSTTLQEINIAFLALVGASIAVLYIWKRETDGISFLLAAWFIFAAGVIFVVAMTRALVKQSWPWETQAGIILLNRLQINLSDTLSPHVAVLFGLIYFGFTVLAVCMAFAFLAWILARFEAFLRGENIAGPALDASLGTTALQVELWVVTASALGLLVIGQFFPATLPSDAPVFTMMIAGFTLKLLFAMMIALCGAVVWLRRTRIVRQSKPQANRASIPPRRLPRLLVNPLIVYPAIAFTLYALVIFAYWFATGDDRFHRRLVDYKSLVVIITIPVTAIVGFLFRQELLRWLHIMTDITNHFYRPYLRFRRSESTAAGDNIDPGMFVIQQRIESRFRAVLEEVLRRNDVTHLTVVAHSQGTIIAIDVLWQEWTSKLLAGKEVHFITLGSPLTHLYQYYFPHRYPPLFRDGKRNETAWGSGLWKTIRSWTNVYRIDDFIGTHIEGDGANQFPMNICLPAGGHTAYWNQDVLRLALPSLAAPVQCAET